jgi:16S rRNA (cytosine1402-N4)-methyltransferase
MGEAPLPPRRRRARYAGTHPRRFDERYKERDPAKYPEMQTHVRAQGRTPAGTHVPILVAEVLAALAPAPGETVADCTVGYGGHAMEFLKRIGPQGRLVGLDADAAQLERTRERLAAAEGRVGLRHANFATLREVMAAEGLAGFDVIFADLGVSSMQIDDPARGFSYKQDGPLDMRMDASEGPTAAEILAKAAERDLSDALAELADEPDHERIAWEIVRRRAARPITRTQELVEAVLAAKGLTREDWKRAREVGVGDLHPAARTFQALRILVNDELGALDEFLRVAPECLRPGGRIGVLAFHSGEDRLVKHSFRDALHAGLYARACAEPVRASAEEVRSNPRSAPARFRWAGR